MVCLLFGHDATWYGEALINGGALSRLTLTQEGEQAVGPAVVLWQTRGIALERALAVPPPHAKDSDRFHKQAFYIEHVRTRHEGFLKALEAWAPDHGIRVVTLPAERIRYWEALLRIELEPKERYAFALALRETPSDQLHAWMSVVDAAEKDGVRDGKKPRKAVETLKKKMGKELLRPFAAKAA